MTSSLQTASRIEKRCDGTHGHQRIEGASGGRPRSLQSQVYPPDLFLVVAWVLRILCVVWQGCIGDHTQCFFPPRVAPR